MAANLFGKGETKSDAGLLGTSSSTTNSEPDPPQQQMMSGYSWRIPCAPFGIPIQIHYTLPIYLCLSLLTSFSSPTNLIFIAIVNGPILFGTILVHEWGHCLMSKVVGGTATHILLWPLGGLAFIGHNAGMCADILVALAGPATHIPMGILWIVIRGDWVVSYSVRGYDLWTAVCIEALFLNIGLFVFNLLIPAYPLDGGRVLANLLLMCGVGCNTAAKICCACTFIVCSGLIAWGLYGWIEQYAGSVMCIIVPLWLCARSWELWKMAAAGQAGEHPLFGRQDSRAVEYRAFDNEPA